ncbi:MAG: hypothetical protein ABI649_00125 [Gaiellaceae bacterium]
MPSHRLARAQWLATAAAAAALAVTGVYLLIIWREGEGELASARVVFVAGCLAAAAVALVLGSRLSPRAQAGLFAAATALLGAWALLGAFSIGLLLVPAAVLAGLAVKDVAGAGRSEAAAGALAAIALVIVGLALT